MIKKLYITSSDEVFSYPSIHTSKEKALTYNNGVKRMVVVNVSIPEIEEEIAHGKNLDVEEDE